MLLGGDECRRTQGGNNNAYCQDNETSWYDWDGPEQHKDIVRFTRGMIALRQSHPVLSQEQFYKDGEIQWFDPQGGIPHWSDPKGKHFGCLIPEKDQRSLCLMFNAGGESVDFRLPVLRPEARWHLAADTSYESPRDLFAAGEEPLLESPHQYRLGPRSSVILLAGQ
jgi:glycogen operon protein